MPPAIGMAISPAARVGAQGPTLGVVRLPSCHGGMQRQLACDSYKTLSQHGLRSASGAQQRGLTVLVWCAAIARAQKLSTVVTCRRSRLRTGLCVERASGTLPLLQELLSLAPLLKPRSARVQLDLHGGEAMRICQTHVFSSSLCPSRDGGPRGRITVSHAFFKSKSSISALRILIFSAIVSAHMGGGSRGCLVHEHKVGWQHDAGGVGLELVLNELSEGVALECMYLERRVVVVWQLHIEIAA